MVMVKGTPGFVISLVAVVLLAGPAWSGSRIADQIRRCSQAMDAVKREVSFALGIEDVKALYGLVRPEKGHTPTFSARLFGDLLARVAELKSYQYRYEVSFDRGKRYIYWRPLDDQARRIGPSRTVAPGEYELAMQDLRAHIPMYCDLLDMQARLQTDSLTQRLSQASRLANKYGENPVFYVELAKAHRAMGNPGEFRNWLAKAKDMSVDKEALFDSLVVLAILMEEVGERTRLESLAKDISISYEQVVIGASVSEAGPYSVAGQSLKKGYLWWERDVNQRHGLLGRPVLVRLYDDRSDPKEVENLYTKLIREDKVHFLLGPSSTELTLAAARVADAYAEAIVATVASPGGIHRGQQRNVFPLYPSEDAYLDGIIDVGFARKNDRYAIVHSDSPVFANAALAGAEKIKQRGGKIVYENKFERGTADFTPIIQTIRQRGDPLLILAAEVTDSVAFLKQYREKGLGSRGLASTNVALPSLFKSLGSLAEGVIAPTLWEPSVKIPYPGMQQFIEGYKKMWGDEPDQHAAAAVGAAQVLEAAVRVVGTLDKKKVRGALPTLETRTIFGDYKYDEKVLQKGKLPVIVEWTKDSQKTIVWPAEAVRK